jgi:hypothetical protein
VHLPYTYLPVLIDGEVVGGAPSEVCAKVAAALRFLKVNGSPTSSGLSGGAAVQAGPKAQKGQNGSASSSSSSNSDGSDKGSSSSSSESDGSESGSEDEAAAAAEQPPASDGMEVDASVEVAWVVPPPQGQIGAYPGLYLFTRSARLLRPVLNLQARKMELVGPLEQVKRTGHFANESRARAHPKTSPQLHVRRAVRLFLFATCAHFSAVRARCCGGIRRPAAL